MALRVREGARVVGHKVGLTSRAMQDQVGINTPDSGILLDYMVVPSGEAVPMPSWDLRAERLTVRTGTTPVAAGEGRDVLGDPLRSVVWLARRLAVFGTGLKAGDVVLAGAVHASIPLPAGETVSVSSPRLPAVSLHVA